INYSLIAGSADFGSWVYLLFIGLALLLFNIWVIAVMMALLMIFSLSRAVNRMTDATQRVQHGDFSARIEIHRRDQIGALQGSFNAMAENLEELVADAARQELLEKDLEIARELQRSLLPDPAELPAAAGLEFETYFEPSSAIGGDYYDLLPMPGDRLAVFIADVSGHGLSAGLRMAMVKSALLILCEREPDPRDVLRHLHRLLRSGFHRGHRRGFVTATLAIVDLERGELTIHNAGHPPTYLLRGGEVREIMLPSPALGGLDGELGQETVELEAGDVVVWLSDGLIEAQNSDSDGDFGYDRIVEALSGLDSDPAEVKEKLLGAVAEHTGGVPPEDDLTVVVMAYRPPTPD
ncbi:MAG: SpoIIE family protein phosphatase, partial [Thermoanaerobaculia bacterium]